MRNLNSLITALVLSCSTLAATGCATIAGDEEGQTEDAASSAGKLAFWNTNGRHYFHLKSGNGAILLTSEAYTSRGGSIGGALSVLTNGVDPAQYTVTKTATGYNLHLKAGNGESIAFSQVDKGWGHLDAAARAARRVIEQVLSQPPARRPFLLNVNIPNREDADQLPEQITRLGRRHASEPVILQTSPRGDTMYWIGPAGDAREAGDGTDFHAVAHGFVSITPLQVDLTDHAAVPNWQSWLVAGTRP
jgi:5'-nucleotidase